MSIQESKLNIIWVVKQTQDENFMYNVPFRYFVNEDDARKCCIDCNRKYGNAEISPDGTIIIPSDNEGAHYYTYESVRLEYEYNDDE